MDDALFAVLARAAGRRVADFTAQGLTNIARAFAAANQSDVLLFAMWARRLSGVSERWVRKRSRQHSVDIGSGGPVGCAAVCSVGGGSRSARE